MAPSDACVLVTTEIPAKTDEPIEVPFRLSTWVGPRNQVIGEGRNRLPRRTVEDWGYILTCLQSIYSVLFASGSSDAAFRCQLCSNLFHYLVVGNFVSTEN